MSDVDCSGESDTSEALEDFLECGGSSALAKVVSPKGEDAVVRQHPKERAAGELKPKRCRRRSPNSGYAPTAKKQDTAVVRRASEYMWESVVGRVNIREIGFHPGYEGGKGIMPRHAHNIALDVVSRGTSGRRYWPVVLIEVPEQAKAAWLLANTKKAGGDPFMAAGNNHEIMKYASFNGSHFIEAHKLVAEGNRTYMNMVNGVPLKLLESDVEGSLIQSQGVHAVVYSEGLWYDKPAMKHLFQEEARIVQSGFTSGYGYEPIHIRDLCLGLGVPLGDDDDDRIVDLGGGEAEISSGSHKTPVYEPRG